MIDEIDYFPRRDRHNKKKKVDSGWGDLKKQKSEQDNKIRNKKKKNDAPEEENDNDDTQS